MIPVWAKEVARYIIISIIIYMAYEVVYEAIKLAQIGKLENAFGIVVSAVFGALTFVLKWMFETKVQS